MLRPAEFVPLIALMMSLVALSIDAMLPALPAIGTDLHAPQRNDTQLVVTSLFLGLGFGQLLFGPLSDYIGRKPATCVGLVLFMFGCVVSTFAVTFEMMITGRVLQGIGVAAPRVVSIALVRDQYDGRQMARIMSFAMAVFILVPTVAPAIGQGIQAVAGWRAIFWTLFAAATIAGSWLIIRQPETLPARHRMRFSIRRVVLSVKDVMRERDAVGYTIAMGFAFSPFIAYLSTVQQIFQDSYGVGELFPVYFGALALAFGVASLVNGHLVIRLGMHRLTIVASLIVTVVSLVSWIVSFAYDGLLPMWMFLLTLSLVFAAVALLFGNLNALAMQPLKHVAGMGAALIALFSTLISVPLGGLIGYTYDGTLYALLGSFALFGAATFAAIYKTARKRM